MHISQLVRGLECEIVGEDCKISGLNYDSRKVQPGDVFFAIRGFKTDGHNMLNKQQPTGCCCSGGSFQCLMLRSRKSLFQIPELLWLRWQRLFFSFLQAGSK